MNLRILFLSILALGVGYASAQTPIQGNALHFDGTDDHVMIPDADALDLTGSYTLECWIRPERFNSRAGLISKYNADPSNGYLLRLGSAAPFNGLSFDGMETATGILEFDRWYHIAAVNNNGIRTIYVNGVEHALSGIPVSVGANTDKLTLGVDYLPSPRYFKGAMDEVRIWNTARTRTQIRADMRTLLNTPSPGLAAYYRFETGTPGGNNAGLTTVTDAAGGHHGAAANFSMTGNTSNWIETAGCTSINYPVPDTWNLANLRLEEDGWLNGTNSSLDREKAMYFDVSDHAGVMTGTSIGFGYASTSDPSRQVPIRVYDGTSGSPGAELGSATITMSEIMGDIADFSWAIKVNNSLIYHYDGGGIDLCESSPNLSNLVISGNSGRFGGGIQAEDSSPIITNTVISGNVADRRGGGIDTFLKSSPVLINVTISGNMAPDDGGGGISRFQSHTTLRIHNSIIYGNTSSVNLSSTNSTLEYRFSLIQGITTDDANGNIDGNTDPHFTEAPSPRNVPFTNGNYMLQVGSPIIDKGNNTLFTGPTDLAGNPRISGAAIDIGAYEYSDALPVTLLSFKALKQENAVHLTWQTTQEINASHFEIHRSADAHAWQAIGTVAAKGSGSYIFTDSSPFGYAQGPPLSTLYSPLSTPSYYRLKITDLDGSFAYSRIEAVSFDKGNKGLAVRIYPNPANSGKVTIDLPGTGGEPVHIQVFDLPGKEIHSVKAAAMELDVSRFSPGVYLVRIRQGSEMAVKKLVVK